MNFIPDDYIRRTSSTIPFGYELSEEVTGYLKPIEEELRILKEVAEAVFHGEISLVSFLTQVLSFIASAVDFLTRFLYLSILISNWFRILHIRSFIKSFHVFSYFFTINFYFLFVTELNLEVST